MKTLLNTLAMCLFAISATSQQTPALDFDHPSQAASTRAAVTDTITYTGLVSGTTVTNQYVGQGAFFLGHDGAGDPMTYDYGTGSWGSVMISDNWYNPIRMNFVDTLDPFFFPALAKKIEFDNPIDSEVDYISFKVYDENDVLIHSYMSTSPEHVTVEFDDYIASYVVFDDSLETAYVVDNILLDISSEYVSVKETKEAVFEAFPNPSSGVFALSASAPIQQIQVFNALGQTVKSIRPNTKNYTLNLEEVGVYFVMVKTGQHSQTQRLIVE